VLQREGVGEEEESFCPRKFKLLAFESSGRARGSPAPRPHRAPSLEARTSPPPLPPRAAPSSPPQHTHSYQFLMVR